MAKGKTKYTLKEGAEKLHFSGKTSKGTLTKKPFAEMTQAELKSILEYYAIGHDPATHPHIQGEAVPAAKKDVTPPTPPTDIEQNEEK